MINLIASSSGPTVADFAARARASWERGVATEADAAGSLNLEEYRASKERDLRATAETAARNAVGVGSTRGFASPADAIGQARDAIDNLREHANAINGIAAHLDPRNLKQLATLFGQEWADDYRARLEAGRADAIDLLGVKQQQISERFTVHGSLVQREDDGSFALGAFTLEASGQDFTVRIGASDAAPADRPAAAETTMATPPLDLRV